MLGTGSGSPRGIYFNNLNRDNNFNNNTNN